MVRSRATMETSHSTHSSTHTTGGYASRHTCSAVQGQAAAPLISQYLYHKVGRVCCILETGLLLLLWLLLGHC